MVVVHDLKEGLDPGFLGGLLRRILADDFLRVLGDAGDEAVAVGAVAGTLVEGADDDGLAAGVPALEDDHSLVGLQELHHFRLALLPSFSSCAPPPSRVCANPNSDGCL